MFPFARNLLKLPVLGRKSTLPALRPRIPSEFPLQWRSCWLMTPQAPLSSNSKSCASTPTERVEFWTGVFRDGSDAFTLPDANPNLVDVFERLQQAKRKHMRLAPDADPKINAFVPLCGRSLDLNYLAEQANSNVFGLDLIPAAMTQWGQENGGLRPLHATAKVSTYASVLYPNLRLIVADIFEFPAAALAGTFDLVWDRGGLTSIPDDLRPRYLSLLRSMLRCQPATAAASAARGSDASVAAAADTVPSVLALEFLSCNLPLDGSLSLPVVQSLLGEAGFSNVAAVKDEDVKASYPSFNPPGLEYLREVVVEARL